MLENQSDCRAVERPAQSRARRGELGGTGPRWFRAPARPRAPALTSAARTAWSRHVPRAAQMLRDHLEMRTRGREGLNAPGRAETRPQPLPRPASPALGAQGRGHNGPPALRSASPVRVPCTPAGPHPREPDSARPPSARGIPPRPVPLRAESGFRRAQPGPPGRGAPCRGQQKSRAAAWAFVAVSKCAQRGHPEPLYTYPWLPRRPPEPGRKESAVPRTAEH